MKPAFYSGATGLIAQQQAMNNIGNNVANVNTTGYQPLGTSFNDLVYMNMYTNAEDKPLNGQGVKAVSTGILVGNGTFSRTSYPLDFAVAGDGFFAVQNGTQKEYTRDGTFALRLENGQTYLSTKEGYHVLDKAGNDIVMQQNEEGGYDYGALINRIGIYTFNYAGALQPISGNRYLATQQSGAAVAVNDESSKILNGCLEVSGTSLVDEMNDMISAQRAFQLSARVVQTADENEQTVNNLRK